MKGLCDIHCHMIPGVDDGSGSMEESLKMLEMEYGDGVRRIVITPHFRYEMFETSSEIIKTKFEELKRIAAGRWADLELYLGCELHSSLDMVEKLRTGERLTMAGSRYVLVEFSGRDPKSHILERTQDLLRHGYRPILAHIERYPSIRDDRYVLEELKDIGAYLQVNADTISGKDGLRARQYAKRLMKEDLVDFVGTDAHGSASRTPGLLQAYQRARKVCGEEYADWLFCAHPLEILPERKS